MKVKNKIVKELIYSSDPLTSLWNHLSEVWKAYIGDFEKGENYTKTLEWFIEETYGELFLETLPQHCRKELRKELSFPLIVMDSMSLREAVYCQKRIDNLEIVGYTFSSLPTETKPFREKLSSKKGDRKQIILRNWNPEDITIDRDADIIWSPFPDKFLENIQAGTIRISSIDDSFEKTHTLLKAIIQMVEAEKLMIISDHGYVRLKSKEVFRTAPPKQDDLKEVMKGRRCIRKSEIDEQAQLKAEDLVSQGYLLENNEYFLVKGRYCWPVRGPYKIYQHGGLSLLECLIPVMEVRK